MLSKIELWPWLREATQATPRSQAALCAADKGDVACCQASKVFVEDHTGHCNKMPLLTTIQFHNETQLVSNDLEATQKRSSLAV
jgi:hypothetical protein